MPPPVKSKSTDRARPNPVPRFTSSERAFDEFPTASEPKPVKPPTRSHSRRVRRPSARCSSQRNRNIKRNLHWRQLSHGSRDLQSGCLLLIENKCLTAYIPYLRSPRRVVKCTNG